MDKVLLTCISFNCPSYVIPLNTNTYSIELGGPGVLRIWGDGLFIFRELGISANYLRGTGEQAHTFGDLGSTAKKLKNINIRLPFYMIL